MSPLKEMNMPNRSKPNVPNCERCGFPCYNVNRHNEHTGVHLNDRECFKAVYEAAVDKAKTEAAIAIDRHVDAYHASEV